jgi:branched-subunit amino acid transport protein AzlD
VVIIWIPLLVCIIGLVVYALSTQNGKAQTLGHDAFWTGLLVTLLELAGRVVSIR